MRSAKLSLVVIAIAVAHPSRAHAMAGTAFSESSRAASLAGAVTALPGDASTLTINPAGLADVREPTMMIGAHIDRLDSWFARTGEPHDDRSRTFGGFGVAIATPLPGPEWLQRVRVGFALDVPAQHALRVSVSDRADAPTSPIYDGPPDRMAASLALAAPIFDRFRLGAGLSIVPSLDAPTDVSYVAGRDPNVDRAVLVRLDRTLQMGVSPFIGMRVDPLDFLSAAVVYRDASISRASGSQRTVAGGILANDPVDFYSQWAPAELAFGVGAGPFARLMLDCDVTLHRWSKTKSGFDRELDQPYKDVWSVRAGAEWRATKLFTVRGGAAYEPTPIPKQVGVTNYLGADTFVLAVGAGFDLRALTGAPLAIDAHARARIGATQTATKNPGALPDAQPDTPGQQIDNIGYPGFASHANAYQLGITFTVFIGKEKR
jgi:long-chain fatty acid transport protein